jgi:hypothetical protein
MSREKTHTKVMDFMETTGLVGWGVSALFYDDGIGLLLNKVQGDMTAMFDSYLCFAGADDFKKKPAITWRLILLFGGIDPSILENDYIIIVNFLNNREKII